MSDSEALNGPALGLTPGHPLQGVYGRPAASSRIETPVSSMSTRTQPRSVSTSMVCTCGVVNRAARSEVSPDMPTTVTPAGDTPDPAGYPESVSYQVRIGPDKNEAPPLSGETTGLRNNEPGMSVGAQTDTCVVPEVLVSSHDTGVVRHHYGYTVTRNDHFARVLQAGQDRSCGPALLGLYVYLSQKPPGWRFAATRIATEMGVGAKAIRTLMAILRALGYVRVVDVRQDDGTVRRLVEFESHGFPDEPSTTEVPKGDFGVTSGNAAKPRVAPAPQDEPSTELPSGALGVTSGNAANPQVAPSDPHRVLGDRALGEGHRQSVLRASTESQVISQSVESPTDADASRDDATDVTTDETSMRAVLEMLDPRVRPTPSRQLAEQLRWVAERGWTPEQLRAEIETRVNPDRAGPGAVVALVKKLVNTPPPSAFVPTSPRPAAYTDAATNLRELEQLCEHGGVTGRCPMCRTTRLASEHHQAVSA